MSLSEIIANYSTPWGYGVAERHLSCGTRLVKTALGEGFRVFQAGQQSIYIPFQ